MNLDKVCGKVDREDVLQNVWRWGEQYLQSEGLVRMLQSWGNLNHDVSTLGITEIE